MPKLTQEQWQEVRNQREAGETFANLAMHFDIDRSSIIRKAQREQWGNGKDVEEIIRRRAAEKMRVVTTPEYDFKDRDAEIDAEAERRAEVERRHRVEWDELEFFRQAALERVKDAQEMGKDKAARLAWVVAKTASEVVRNHIAALAAKQFAECKAHRLSDAPSAGVTHQIILEIPERGYEPTQ